jgi:pimeloyl-ACP methyl ester carboxylesterase
MAGRTADGLMHVTRVQAGSGEIVAYQVEGRDGAAVQFIWGHGWGHSHAQFLPLARSVAQTGPSLLIDFPGFGAAPVPPAIWGTADYADAVAAWLKGLPPARRIWVGHSFGCRVGLQLAARHPGIVDGLFLVAAAGLRPHRSTGKRLRMVVRRWTFKALRSLLPEGPARERLRQRFGSADYARAGPLRPILVKVIGEDLSEVARAVRCPVALVFGDQDKDTPPEMGERLKALCPRATLTILRGYDHHTILTEGQHQVVHRLTEFVREIAA